MRVSGVFRAEGFEVSWRGIFSEFLFDVKLLEFFSY